jgi:hypothetical protein
MGLPRKLWDRQKDKTRMTQIMQIRVIRVNGRRGS